MARQASVVRLSARGQIVIPALLRRRLGVRTGFAAAPAQELNAGLHTTDGELVRQLANARLAVTPY